MTSGATAAHRCPRCRGIWIDPVSFQRLCEDEARAPDDETAITRASRSEGARRAPATAGAERVRYRACPVCREIMNRDNFGRASGVIIDVCRPHGAWLDRGELAAIRRFLRAGGVRRFERVRALDREERGAIERPGVPAPPGDVLDVILGGDSSFDVPSRIPLLPIAIGFAALGAGLLWEAFASPGGAGIYDAAADLGLGCLVLALGAFVRWVDRR